MNECKWSRSRAMQRLPVNNMFRSIRRHKLYPVNTSTVLGNHHYSCKVVETGFYGFTWYASQSDLTVTCETNETGTHNHATCYQSTELQLAMLQTQLRCYVIVVLTGDGGIAVDHLLLQPMETYASSISCIEYGCDISVACPLPQTILGTYIWSND